MVWIFNIALSIASLLRVGWKGVLSSHVYPSVSIAVLILTIGVYFCFKRCVIQHFRFLVKLLRSLLCSLEFPPNFSLSKKFRGSLTLSGEPLTFTPWTDLRVSFRFHFPPLLWSVCAYPSYCYVIAAFSGGAWFFPSKRDPSSLFSLAFFALAGNFMGSVTPWLLVLFYINYKGLTGCSFYLSDRIYCNFHISFFLVWWVEI